MIETLWYDYDYDVDGIVAILDRFTSISAFFTYLGILPREKLSLNKQSRLHCQDHLPLANFSRKGLECLRWSASINFLKVMVLNFIWLYYQNLIGHIFST